MRGDGYRDRGDTRPSRYYNSIFEAQSFVCGHFQVQLQRMTKIVLLRHGESVWNKENRFTGWTDVDLSEKGLVEAREAGRLLKLDGFGFDLPCFSVLNARSTMLLSSTSSPQVDPPQFFGRPLSFITARCRG